MTPIAIAQQILDGKWRHAPAALRACQRGEWSAFAREVAPAKPLLLGRRDFLRCLTLAERSLRGPETIVLTLVPAWACSTEDAVSNEWVAVHGVALPGKPLVVREPGPFIAVGDASPCADALWACTVRRWTAGVVAESSSYAADVPLPLRAGAYCVVELDIDEVLEVTVQETEPVPRPTREVPMFASWLEPRVKVPSEIAAQLRALCFTADESDAP